jgi:hypothetical protein
MANSHVLAGESPPADAFGLRLNTGSASELELAEEIVSPARPGRHQVWRAPLT